MATTDPASPPADDRDEAALRDPRMARTALIAGVASVVTAPAVIGLIPAAIGLQSGLSHLRHRRGARVRAWLGLGLSTLGALGSALAAVAFGSVLMSVLLQRSAVHQAQGWIGGTAEPWTFVGADGTPIASDALVGSTVLVDVFSPHSPMCARTSRTIAAFAAARDDVTVISWSPEASPQAMAFARECGATHAVAVGPQEVGFPFDLIAAKPTLIVLDGDGVVRAAVLGAYDERGLESLVAAARVPYAQPDGAKPHAPRPN